MTRVGTAPRDDRRRKKVSRGLDHIGIFLYTAGLTFCLLGLAWGGVGCLWRCAPVSFNPFIPSCLVVHFRLRRRRRRSCETGVNRSAFLEQVLEEYAALLLLIFVTGFVYFLLDRFHPRADRLPVLRAKVRSLALFYKVRLSHAGERAAGFAILHKACFDHAGGKAAGLADSGR